MLSPDSPAWSNSLALCAVMKDENITDVREWLQYYRCVQRSAAALVRFGSLHVGLLSACFPECSAHGER